LTWADAKPAARPQPTVDACQGATASNPGAAIGGGAAAIQPTQTPLSQWLLSERDRLAQRAAGMPERSHRRAVALAELRALNALILTRCKPTCLGSD
jgi:hypothetical protein